MADLTETEEYVLYRLCYCSRNLIPAPVFPDEIREILKFARKNNERLGITGFLLLSQDCFMQTLEGPEIAIKDLYHAIAHDPRHCDVSILEQSHVEQRQYAEWSMAFTTGRDEVDALAGVERNHIFGEHGSDAEAVMLRQVTVYQSTKTP
jgi:hypothetical protein